MAVRGPKTFEVAEFMTQFCESVSQQIGYPCRVMREYQPEWRGAPAHMKGAGGRPTYVLVIDAPHWAAHTFRLGRDPGHVKAAVAMLADVLTNALGEKAGRDKRAMLGAMYGAGDINVARMSGEYPPRDYLGEMK